MELTERLRAWSHLRHRLTDAAASPDQALRAIVAAYATHPTCPLTLAVRTRGFTAASYRRLDRERKAIRIPAMRRTVFLVPRTYAARIFSAVRASPAHALRPLKRLGFSHRDYETAARRILAAASQPATSRDLQAAADIKGPMLGTVLRCLRYEGRILSLAGESLNSSAHRYVSTTSWFPGGLDVEDPGGALEWLAGQYLRAYGPIRIEDFAWWTGVSKRLAARALRPHDTISIDHGLLLLRRDRPAFERVKRLRDSIDVLPKWDAYTMGFAPDGRQRFVHPDVQQRVYTPMGVGLPGDGNPVVLVDGEVVATWTHSLKGGAQLQPFETLPQRTRARIEVELKSVSALLLS